MTTRTRIIAEARAWIGTPYRHQASLKGVGCDCLGLVRGVWRALHGAEPEATPRLCAATGRRRAALKRSRDAALRHLVRARRPRTRSRPATCCCSAGARAIRPSTPRSSTAPDLMVHAHDGAAVAEVAIAPWWRRRASPYAFRFPGSDANLDETIMAALVLSVAGAAAGGAVFGPVGAIAGPHRRRDRRQRHRPRAVRRRTTERNVEGPRLADLDVMASTEGAPIPRVYGRARLAGQVIWATQLEEVVSTRSETERRRQGRRRAAAPRPPRPTAISPISRSACAKGRSAASRASGPTASRSISTGITMRIYTGSESQTRRSADRRQGGRRQRAGLSRARLCGVRAAAARRFRQPHSAAVVRGDAPGRRGSSRWCAR